MAARGPMDDKVTSTSGIGGDRWGKGGRDGFRLARTERSRRARPDPEVAPGGAPARRIRAARCAGDRGAHRGRPAPGDEPRGAGLPELDGGTDSHLTHGRPGFAPGRP